MLQSPDCSIFFIQKSRNVQKSHKKVQKIDNYVENYTNNVKKAVENYRVKIEL